MLKITCAMLMGFTLLGAPVMAQTPDKVSPAGDLSSSLADRLFQLHAGGEKDSQNLIFSPTSIYLALSMTAEGARGETATQMQKALGQTGTPDQAFHDKVQNLIRSLAQAPSKTSEPGAINPDDAAPPKFDLALTNRLWLDKAYAIEPAFSGVVEKNYLAKIEPVDFLHAAEPSRKAINDAIAQQTRDKIKDLLGEGTITANTRLVLTNAVYFKAAWKTPFEKSATTPSRFHQLDGTVTTDVPTMNQTEKLRFFEDDRIKLVELPYKGNAVSMLLVLSKDPDAKKSLEIEKSLADLLKWTDKLALRQVTLAMPKFKFDSQMELSEDLKSLGMTDAFTEKADFSGITTREHLQISGVIHKAFIEVNEEGTEAAAATAVAIFGMAYHEPPPPAEFIADRPFVFAIRDNQSGEILFSGRVARP